MQKLDVFLLVFCCLAMVGCNHSSDPDADHEHSHDVPDHLPHSLVDLCREIRVRVEKIDAGSTNDTLRAELTDLVSWAPEFAADTDISERRWQPIYDLSEKIRSSILESPEAWGTERRDQVVRLCQISEDAWRTLPMDKRVDRFQAHDHDHDHDHGHAYDDDHDHGPSHSEVTP